MSFSSTLIRLICSYILLIFFLTEQDFFSVYSILAFLGSIIVVYEMFSVEEQPYSLHKVVNVFLLFFFILANAMQYAENSVVTSLNVVFETDEYVFFQIITLCIIVLYNTTYYLCSNRKENELDAEPFLFYNEPICSPKHLLWVSTISLLFICLHFRSNMNLMFFRGLMENGSVVVKETSLMNLLFGKFIRPIPFCCVVIGFLFQIPSKYRLLLTAEMLLALFPLGLPRNAVAMFWLPFCLLTIPFFKKKNFFVASLFLGLMVIFPFFDNFRYYTGSVSFDFNFSYLNTMNFDASQEFMAVIKMNIITLGRQFLGVIFFFIPRTIWPTKPIGSGAFVAESQHVFSNISMPFFAEGFINFGYLGVLIAVLFLAWFSAKCDKLFWLNKKSSKNMFAGIYLILIGSMMFVLRGDLMSAYAYTLGASCSYMVVYKFTVKKNEK